TAQNANRVGRLDPKTGEIKLLTPPTPKSRPYGMAVNSKGTVFYVAFGANKVGSVDPKTLEIREYPLPDSASRPRRITITRDDVIWYSDFSRGYLGRLDPATGKVTEWPSPSGPKSEPYGISAINDVIWYSESGATPNTVVRFDPKTEKLQSWAIPGGGNIVRNTSVTRDGNFVLANRLGQSEQLLLTSGELRSAAAAAADELGPIALRERSNKCVGAGDPGRLEHGFLGHRVIPEREILENCPREQLHDLRHDAQDPPALRFLQGARVTAGDPDGARPRRVESSEQMEGAGLAGAGTSNQRHVLAGVDHERDAMQDALPFRVSERDVVE